MAVVSRPKVKDGEKGARERIIDEFWVRARKTPVRKMSARMLSDAAGCNRSTFYYYFDGLAGLVEHVTEQAGYSDILAREFAAVMAGEGDAVELSGDDLAKLDDLCTIVHLNRAELAELGAVDQLNAVWSRATGVDPGSLSPERRALLEFATQGFLATLSYRGSLDNAIPYDELSLIIRNELAPNLMRAITGGVDYRGMEALSGA